MYEIHGNYLQEKYTSAVLNDLFIQTPFKISLVIILQSNTHYDH